MTEVIFVYESNKTFNYRAFAKYLARCPNILWTVKPGFSCPRARVRRAIEIELNVDEETADKVIDTTEELGFVTIDLDNGIYIIPELREEE